MKEVEERGKQIYKRSILGWRKRTCKGPEVWYVQGIAIKAPWSEEREVGWDREIRRTQGTGPYR